MAKPTKPNDGLLLKIVARLADVRIKEAYISRQNGIDIYAMWEPDGTITVNPIPHVVDSVIHEVLHELYPNWNERAVLSMTGKLMRALSDDQIKTIYEEYQERVEHSAKDRTL